MQNLFLAASTLLLSMIYGVAGNEQRENIPEMKPSLSGATSWLNTQPLNLKNLQGKVVLIDFWTYTCINWRRTLPYIREWEAKYRDHGLVVIGVHTPEFLFEYETDNVSKAIQEMDIVYPVAIDNGYKIWRSFNNNYWPALYLIDTKGKIRYQKFGEGDYAEAELQIQQLLSEASGKNISINLATPSLDGVEAAPDWENLQSPENFLGYNRTEGFASPGGVVADQRKIYTTPQQLKLNQWALTGEWTMGEESILLNKEQGKVTYRFHARDLHLIMGPAIPGHTIKFRVLIDDKAPGLSHALDVDSDGYGIVTEQRMYQLIRQQGPIIDREFQIEFFDPEVEVFDFTFG